MISSEACLVLLNSMDYYAYIFGKMLNKRKKRKCP